MTVPNQITCALRTDNTTNMTKKFAEGGEYRFPKHENDILTVTPPSVNTAHAGIFRPITEERSFWCPPMYRNTSLLSSPSKEFYFSLSSTSSSSSSRMSHRQYDNEEHDLPTDFIPPRHSFASPSSDEVSSPRHSAIKLQPDDVVCGRGAPVQFHPGNQKYRELIKQFETSYLCAKRNSKPEIAMEVLEILKTRNVRFVKREKEECGMIWVEISEKRAYEKVCQSLRDGAPELRRRMMKAKKEEEDVTAASSRGPNRILFADQSLFFREEHSCTPIPL